MPRTTSCLKPASNTPTLLLDYPGADIILRSSDSRHFRVPKSCIVKGSSVLDKLIKKALHLSTDAQGEAPLPVVQLPESGEILHILLTFVFPGDSTPLLPSSTKTMMELLSLAQKYQMVSTLDHIRGSIMRQSPPPTGTRKNAALRMYSLAQEYGLHHEALQAAQDIILKYPMDMEDMVELVQGPSLYELWKYYENFQAILKSDLTEFKTSGAGGTLIGLQCAQAESDYPQIPRWLGDYIKSIGDATNLFDVFEFHTALANHISGTSSQRCRTCRSFPNESIRNFWEALAAVVQNSFEKAKSGLRLVLEREHSSSEAQVKSSLSLPEPLNLPDANIVIRSSDFVNFRVHKSVLAVASPFFRDLLSLPQPSDAESIEGLPVVQLAEDAEVLNSLVSMLYPVPPAIPNSYEKVFHLLATCQKYDMVQVQSSIRAEVDRGNFPAPVKTEAFRAYAIASSNGLVPEMDKAARLTLGHPMTFETIGEGLRWFQGSALCDLARFRERELVRKYRRWLSC